QQPRYMIAAEECQRAFARNLDFEQARVTTFFVNVVRIADDLARYSHSYQGAIPITDRAIHVYIPIQDAGEHAVSIALAERQRALLKGNRYVALDQLVDQVHRQFQTAQARPKHREGFFMLTAQIRPHFLLILLSSLDSDR